MSKDSCFTLKLRHFLSKYLFYLWFEIDYSNFIANNNNNRSFYYLSDKDLQGSTVHWFKIFNLQILQMQIYFIYS